jgi:predicted O-methyltransferase YrrM
MSRISDEPIVGIDLVQGRSFSFGQLGGVVLGTVTLAKDGTIAGSRHPNETTWRIDERGHLLFVDSGGQVTTRFTEVSTPNGQLVLLGEFLDSGCIHYISAPSSPHDPTPTPPAVAGHRPPPIDHLSAPVWGLGRLGGGVVTDLFILPDGRLRGCEGPNEARWEIDDEGRLLFFGVDGQMTTTFDTFVPTSRGHAWIGPFVDGHTIHYLVPRFDPLDPHGLPQFADSLIDRQRLVSQGWPSVGPPLLSRERYAQSRQHLFSLARGEVLPEPSVDSGAHVDALRQAFDETFLDFGLDPRALFWFSIKGSDATALYDYVTTAKPATCLQIGTFAGFSALLIADALRRGGGGHVTALDPEIPHENVMTPVDVARRVAERLELTDHCSFVRGWGSTMIGLPPFERWKHTVPLRGQSLLTELGSVDLVFIDADHSVSATVADFMLVKDFVSEGGAVVFHDVFNWPSVTEAVEIILNDIHYDDGAHRLWEVDINTGPDGLAVLRRRPTPPSPALTVEVVDDASGAPVPGAEVTAIGHDTAAASSRGEVVFFREIPRGTSIEVVAPGYRRQRVRLGEPTDGGATRTMVRLRPDG